MSKIWCSEKDCYYNYDCRCKAKDVIVYEGECITNRYDKPGKHQATSRSPAEVHRDRDAKHVADKIKADMMARMGEELKK